MARKNPFKHHRFPKDVILLAKRGIRIDAATVNRWVQKFGPEIRKRAYGKHRSGRGLQRHVNETYVRVNGRWCYLWRAVDQRGQLIDFRLTGSDKNFATHQVLLLDQRHLCS